MEPKHLEHIAGIFQRLPQAIGLRFDVPGAGDEVEYTFSVTSLREIMNVVESAVYRAS